MINMAVKAADCARGCFAAAKSSPDYSPQHCERSVSITAVDMLYNNQKAVQTCTQPVVECDKSIARACSGANATQSA